MQLKIDQFLALKGIEDSIKDAFDGVKVELDEHLDAINQNSIEIQANYDFLEEVNKKVDTLSARIDELTSLFTHVKTNQEHTLTSEEKDIFVVLYTAQEPLSFEEMGNRSGLSIYAIEDIVQSLIEKKIPVLKKMFANKTLFILEEKFKDAQKKFNIIDLHEQWVQ